MIGWGFIERDVAGVNILQPDPVPTAQLVKDRQHDGPLRIFEQRAPVGPALGEHLVRPDILETLIQANLPEVQHKRSCHNRHLDHAQIVVVAEHLWDLVAVDRNHPVVHESSICRSFPPIRFFMVMNLEHGLAAGFEQLSVVARAGAGGLQSQCGKHDSTH